MNPLSDQSESVTPEMVERAATAIYRWQWDSDDALTALDIGEAADYREMARVALNTVEMFLRRDKNAESEVERLRDVLCRIARLTDASLVYEDEPAFDQERER